MRPHQRLGAWNKALELIIAHRLRYLDDARFSGLSTPLERIGRLITGLSKHVRGNIVRQART
jgi:hypothetical protein